MAKYIRDLHAHKIKRITTVKRAMTCTTIFLNTAVSFENLLLLVKSIFFLRYYTCLYNSLSENP